MMTFPFALVLMGSPNEAYLEFSFESKIDIHTFRSYYLRLFGYHFIFTDDAQSSL